MLLSPIQRVEVLCNTADVVEEIGCEASEIEEYSFLEKGRLTPSSIPDNIIHLF